MRWLITGSGGQLGQCLVGSLEARPGQTLVGAFDHSTLDIARPGALANLLAKGGADAPDIVVNAAAFTAVDRCEEEAERAQRVNADAPGWLAEDCWSAGLAYVHVSTDYVFSGVASEPYAEDAPVGPRTAYGRSKAEGERRVMEAHPKALVVRTSWLFGPGQNFVAAILRQAQRRGQGLESGPLRVVSDQCGCPTYAGDLAEGILELAGVDPDREPMGEGRGQAPIGIFHLANRGKTTWFDFARAILDETGYGEIELEPTKTSDLGLPAERPAWSVLGCRRAAELGVNLRPWREALVAYLNSAAGIALQEEQG
ncbi:MAG: dTDP-4-dehydrorhamnose reductase [Myxococcota bacterium]|nr:dTDP-4-dehydrorhamnose reductase [Myxococcota bacterium]